MLTGNDLLTAVRNLPSMTDDFSQKRFDDSGQTLYTEWLKTCSNMQSITEQEQLEFYKKQVEFYKNRGISTVFIENTRNLMTTKLVDYYVNFIMDGMSQQIKEEMLYEYLVNEYKDLSEKELTQQILENYGDEWFEYLNENNLK